MASAEETLRLNVFWCGCTHGRRHEICSETWTGRESFRVQITHCQFLSIHPENWILKSTTLPSEGEQGSHLSPSHPSAQIKKKKKAEVTVIMPVSRH